MDANQEYDEGKGRFGSRLYLRPDPNYFSPPASRLCQIQASAAIAPTAKAATASGWRCKARRALDRLLAVRPGQGAGAGPRQRNVKSPSSASTFTPGLSDAAFESSSRSSPSSARPPSEARKWAGLRRRSTPGGLLISRASAQRAQYGPRPKLVETSTPAHAGRRLQRFARHRIVEEDVELTKAQEHGGMSAVINLSPREITESPRESGSKRSNWDT